MIANCPKCWTLFNRSPERQFCEACHWRAQFDTRPAERRPEILPVEPRSPKTRGPKRGYLSNRQGV